MSMENLKSFQWFIPGACMSDCTFTQVTYFYEFYATLHLNHTTFKGEIEYFLLYISQL